MGYDGHTNGERSHSTGPLEGRLLSELERAGVSVLSLPRHRHVLRNFSATQSHNLIQGLHDKGWLVSIERGKYLVVPRAAKRGWHEHPFVVAAGLAPGDYYISFWSALSFHNLTEQLPRVAQVALAEARRSSISFQGWEYQFVYLARTKFYGYALKKFPALNGAATVEVQVAEPEKAVIDSIDRQSLAGGFIEVVKSVRRGLEAGTLDMHLMLSNASKYPNAAAVARLGYVLTRLGVEEAGHLRGRLRRHGYPVYLSESTPRAGASFDGEWNLWINVPGDLFDIEDVD